MTNEALRDLSGGKKQMWLRGNRQKVLEFYYANGEEATKKEFRLTHDTLNAFLNRPSVDYNKMTESKRALYIAQTAVDTARENTRRVFEVQEELRKIYPYVQFVYALSQLLRAAQVLPDPGETPVSMRREALKVPEVKNGRLVGKSEIQSHI